MKKTLVFFLIAAVWTGALRGDGFQPSVLEIELPEIVYANNATDVDIPVHISGSQASVWMVISTLHEREQIHAVQNGNLGWRYVNQIDTTEFISGPFHLDVGDQVIPWDGKGDDGEYFKMSWRPCTNSPTHRIYVWGYASESQREPACDYIQVSHGMADKHVSIIGYDEDSVPLTNPYFFGNDPACINCDGVNNYDSNMFFKWSLGADPSDASSFLTSWVISDNKYHPSSICSTADIFSPDQNYFVVSVNDTTHGTGTMEKWQFVSEGNAVRDQDWGSWDNIEFVCSENADNSTQFCTLTMGPEFIWIAGGSPYDSEKRILMCYDDDAEEVFSFDVADYDVHGDDFENRALQYIIPYDFHYSYKTRKQLLVHSATSCFIQMISPESLIEEGPNQTKEDVVIWENGNGDFFLDMNFTDDGDYPWKCISDDPVTSHIKTAADVDANGFSVIWTDYSGLVSFGVLAPDGKGVGYGTYADEIIPTEGGSRWGGQLLDTGSNFDGMYIVNTEQRNGKLGTSYVGFDSAESGLYVEYTIKIPGPISVAEDISQPVILHQNTPNPFNPSTSIPFTLPEAGHVSLAVYNIAGQQVAVLQDGELSAGEHAAAWHAEGFPAGVYFYTLASGGFSRTKKMTLVK